ncbi:MAG TPA: hypothetical protein VHD33_01225, partial [Legionellaceae bacterium]|nr:hypothetical protein [Legionellaceae bacterium]
MMNFGLKYGRVLRSLLFFCAMNGCIYAEELAELKPISPLAALHANWVFSGSVSKETGENYEYFFQVKRNDDRVYALVSLIDAQTKSVVFIQDTETQLIEQSADQWNMGDIFLRYNPINSSWVFGVKKENQIGFNFKLDMLNQSAQKTQLLQPKVTMKIVQTGQVNGHLQLKENEAAQFVSGKHAWFRQITVDTLPTKPTELHGLLCRFDDGSGLYSMKIMNSEIIRGTYSGMYNHDGIAAPISQFVYIDHLSSGPWRVRVPYPKLQFELDN